MNLKQYKYLKNKMTLTEKIMIEAGYPLYESNLAQDAINKLVEKIKGEFYSYYQKSLKNTKSKVYKTKDSLRTSIQKIGELKQIKIEAENLKNLAHAGLNWVLKGFPADVLKQGMYLEDGDIIYSDEEEKKKPSKLHESFNLIEIFKKIIERLKHTFPFNLFEDFTAKIESFTKTSLNYISKFLNKVHAIDTVYDFVVIPAIVGTLAEVFSEDAIEGTILTFIPGIELLFKIISILSYSITIGSLIQIILKDLGMEDE